MQAEEIDTPARQGTLHDLNRLGEALERASVFEVHSKEMAMPLAYISIIEQGQLT